MEISGGDLYLEHAVRASLVDYLDKPVIITLRDGRHLIGELITFDQYSNVVLHNTYERKICDGSYTDVKLGTYLIRGENIIIMGERDKTVDTGLKEVTLEAFTKIEEDHKAKTGFTVKNNDLDCM